MAFSGTEAFLMAMITVLISLASAGAAVMATVWRMSRKFVSVDNCRDARAACGELRAHQQSATDEKSRHLQEGIDDLKKSTRIQYHMLRALVSHMPNLSASDRERILNAGNGDT